MLVDSFGVLKEDALENIHELQSIIAQMLAINPELALNMWQHLLLDNYNAFKEDSGHFGLNYQLGAYMLHLLTNEDEFINVEASFVSNKQLTSIVFSESIKITESLFWVIAHLIQNQRLNEANQLLSLLFHNHVVTNIDGDDYRFCSVITGVIEKMLDNRDYGSCFSYREHTKKFDNNVQDLIYFWIEKLDDAREIAKAHVAYAKIC